jgi:hypothetical protein
MDSVKGRRKRGSKWIQGAIKHPGAATAAAHREGESVGEWASEHEHDSGTTGKRARLAKTLRAMHHKGGKK